MHWLDALPPTLIGVWPGLRYDDMSPAHGKPSGEAPRMSVVTDTVTELTMVTMVGFEVGWVDGCRVGCPDGCVGRVVGCLLG